MHPTPHERRAARGLSRAREGHRGRRGLEISYNMLNLPSEVHKTDSTDSARFIYLSDGTKLKTIEGDGHTYTVPGPLAHGSAWDDLHRRHFGGKEEVGDGGLDLLDFGARYYDPYSFSWTSVDPMGDLFPAKSPYQYCNANPVRFVDPSGKSSYTFNGQRYVVDDGDNGTSGNSEEQFLRKISARTNNYALEDGSPKNDNKQATIQELNPAYVYAERNEGIEYNWSLLFTLQSAEFEWYSQYYFNPKTGEWRGKNGVKPIEPELLREFRLFGYMFL